MLNPLNKDIILDTYHDELIGAGNNWGEVFSTRQSALAGNKATLVTKILKIISTQSTDLPPRAKSFMTWLRDQPEYALANGTTLTLIMKRKIAFSQLKDNPTPLEADNRQQYDGPDLGTVKKWVDKIIEQQR